MAVEINDLETMRVVNNTVSVIQQKSRLPMGVFIGIKPSKEREEDPKVVLEVGSPGEMAYSFDKHDPSARPEFTYNNIVPNDVLAATRFYLDAIRAQADKTIPSDQGRLWERRETRMKNLLFSLGRQDVIGAGNKMRDLFGIGANPVLK